MADPQDRPDETPDAALPPPEPPEPPEPQEVPTAEHAPHKAAKKTPAKAAKKSPAKAAKKAPAKKAPAKKVAPALQPGATNGSRPIALAAREAAARAKSTVDAADNPVAQPTSLPLPASRRSPVPLAVAIVTALLAVLLIRQLRGRSADDA